jgi:Family of unknown function (DUF6082)
MRQRLYATSITLTMLVILFLVVISPLALGLFAKFKSNWILLSNIGQTYGAISALLAAIGLVGVAVTVILQIGEMRRSHADTVHSRHFDLYRMVMEDPSLMAVSASVARLPTIEERKHSVFVNLQLQFWLMLWDIGGINESALRGYAADLFGTAPGKAFWEEVGSDRMSLSTGARREKRFLEIVNEEYLRNAITQIDISEKGEACQIRTHAPNRKRVAFVLAGGLAIAIPAVLRAIRKR